MHDFMLSICVCILKTDVLHNRGFTCLYTWLRMIKWSSFSIKVSSSMVCKLINSSTLTALVCYGAIQYYDFAPKMNMFRLSCVLF